MHVKVTRQKGNEDREEELFAFMPCFLTRFSMPSPGSSKLLLLIENLW